MKRFRRDSVIPGTVAKLDGENNSCMLLCFVHVATEGWSMTRLILELKALADVEAGLILKVRTSGPASLEKLLSRIQEIQGVRSTRSYVALGPYLERGPMPGLPDPISDGVD